MELHVDFRPMMWLTEDVIYYDLLSNVLKRLATHHTSYLVQFGRRIGRSLVGLIWLVFVIDPAENGFRDTCFAHLVCLVFCAKITLI